MNTAPINTASSAAPTPREQGYAMPAEWGVHVRTWMEFPPANDTFGHDLAGSLGEARAAWMLVASAIAAFEPVTMIANVGDGETARAMVPSSANVHLIERPINDAWFRDSGPTFVTNGTLGATHWRFNAWGNAGFSTFEDEQHVGRDIATQAGARVFESSMVNEGGAIHVDGDGTVMITETVQLDPDRNSGWTHAQVEQNLRDYLGVSKVLWLPRGLTKDYDRFGTRGHIDMFACFVQPGVVLAHVQPDRDHPDFEVSREYLGLLRTSTDARGRTLEVVEVRAPETLEDEHGIVDWNYVNHYLCNGAVILCGFNDPRDKEAADLLARLHPTRRVVQIDARPIFAHGGGIHCITQQQPTTHR